MHQRVAVLIDGGYVREQYKKLYGKLPADAAMFAKQVHDLAYSHAQKATASCDLPSGDASLKLFRSSSSFPHPHSKCREFEILMLTLISTERRCSHCPNQLLLRHL